ncbi:NUDIX domain-containing protein [Jannaschia sp. 2305UL9-9]|uniref:NUDIX domain-containing protein n=1 Tax=Jannaschia sp. 2305UL9-9 TaxID=3121638 RepID=UPI0035276DC9
MTRLFLFGTLRWPDLLNAVAGQDIPTIPATLPGWQVARASTGDWPLLIPGQQAAEGLLTDPLDPDALGRLNWYEVAFGYVPEVVNVMVDGAEVPAMVYRHNDPGGASGQGWDLDDWIAAHGERTLIASSEILRAEGRLSPDQMMARRGVVHARAHGVVMGRATTRPITVGGGPVLSDVTVEEIRYPYDGFHRVEEWLLDHPRFDGTRSGLIERAISHVTDATTVLPYDPVRDRVLVVEQIRVGAVAKGDPRPWMIEPVAGLIDAGETPESTALRECEEEAGLTLSAADLHFVARYYPSPGGLAQVLHSYVALVDLPDDAGGLHGLEEEAEDIRAHLIPLDDLVAMISTCEAANAPLIVSAQWLALHRERLRLNG